MKVFEIKFVVKTDEKRELAAEYLVAAKNLNEALMILGKEDPLDYLDYIFDSVYEPDTHINEIEHLDYKGAYPSVLYHFFEWIE